MELDGTLNFLPGEKTKVITIGILDDLFLEENETFHVSISTDNEGVRVARSNATVIIRDTDGRWKLNS